MSRSGLWAQAPFPVDAMQHNSAAADRKFPVDAMQHNSAAADRKCALNPQACQ